jgi:hypothetical protein
VIPTSLRLAKIGQFVEQPERLAGFGGPTFIVGIASSGEVVDQSTIVQRVGGAFPIAEALIDGKLESGHSRASW